MLPRRPGKHLGGRLAIDLGAGEPLGERPDRLRVRDGMAKPKPKPQGAHEREPTLIRNSVRSGSDSEWLACRIMTFHMTA